MLKIKNISKIYEVDSFKQKALDNVSINFRKCEFVSILGPSGSGKTTLLNIIGGLDKYSSGDLVINNISTKDFTDRDWDTYRNHKVGFVFQNYNLISHQSVLSNVELALTLSGVSKVERRKRSIEALKQVGLIDHINKRPNQLSGGQMQRVAIARSLVNNPDILLADEPTGALDSKTSVQIMELLKKVSKDRLVIMVTHNPELAHDYSTRIINLSDGKIINDSCEFDGDDEDKISVKDKKTSMSFKTALSLSLNNLLTKKGRTILTALAGSIGIIGIALILSLSSGVQNYIDNLEEETLTSYPLSIQETTMDFSSVLESSMTTKKKYDDDKIHSKDILMTSLSMMGNSIQTNNLYDFKKYIESNSDINKYTSSIGYEYNLDLQLFKKIDNKYLQVNPNNIMDSIGMGELVNNYNSYNTMGNSKVFRKMIDNKDLFDKLYSLIAGKMPSKYNEVLLLVDNNNMISDYALYTLGLKDQNELKKVEENVMKGEKTEVIESSFSIEEILDLEFKLLLNPDYYKKVNNNWVSMKDNTSYMNDILNKAESIKVVGIVRINSSNASDTGGIIYTDELEKYVIDYCNNSNIVKEQKKNREVNVLTGIKFSNGEFNYNDLTKEQQYYLANLPKDELAKVIASYQNMSKLTYKSVLESLGAIDLERPSMINFYPKGFDEKEHIIDFINEYNENEKNNGREKNIISYSDMVGILMSSITNIVDIISYVLIGFVSISLVVSSIMIGIITYISVLERTKEIGILRSIGASKKDISRVFNAETFIVGLFSGILGILVTLLLNVPINIIINSLASVDNISSLPLYGAFVLIVISTLLTMFAGLIPSINASKKDPVEALRSE